MRKTAMGMTAGARASATIVPPQKGKKKGVIKKIAEFIVGLVKKVF